MERCGYGEMWIWSGVMMIDDGYGDEAIFTCERETSEGGG